MEKLSEALALLAEQLGTTVDKLWEVLLAQAQIEAQFYLAGVWILGLVAFAGVIISISLAIYAKAQEESGFYMGEVCVFGLSVLAGCAGYFTAFKSLAQVIIKFGTLVQEQTLVNFLRLIRRCFGANHSDNSICPKLVYQNVIHTRAQPCGVDFDSFGFSRTNKLSNPLGTV